MTRSPWLVALVGFVAMVAGTPVGPAGFGVFVAPMSADLGCGDLRGGAIAAGTIASPSGLVSCPCVTGVTCFLMPGRSSLPDREAP